MSQTRRAPKAKADGAIAPPLPSPSTGSNLAAIAAPTPSDLTLKGNNSSYYLTIQSKLETILDHPVFKGIQHMLPIAIKAKLDTPTRVGAKSRDSWKPGGYKVPRT